MRSCAASGSGGALVPHPGPSTATLRPYTTLFRSDSTTTRPESTWVSAAGPGTTSVAVAVNPDARLSTSPSRSAEHTSELPSLRHLVSFVIVQVIIDSAASALHTTAPLNTTFDASG